MSEISQFVVILKILTLIINLLPEGIWLLLVSCFSSIVTLIVAFIGFYSNRIVIIKEKSIDLKKEMFSKFQDKSEKIIQYLSDIVEVIGIDYVASISGKVYKYPAKYNEAKRSLVPLIRIYIPIGFGLAKKFDENIFAFHQLKYSKKIDIEMFEESYLKVQSSSKKIFDLVMKEVDIKKQELDSNLE